MATGRECLHLEGVKHFKPQEPPPLLQLTSIDEMFQKGLISSSTKQDCSKLNQQATQDGTTCVYQVCFFEEYGFSGCEANFSVFTSKVDSWSLFGRTRVTLGTDSGKWTCCCKCTKKRKCVHIYVSICWTFQERRHLLRGREMDFSSDTDNHLDTKDIEPWLFGKADDINSVQIKKKNLLNTCGTLKNTTFKVARRVAKHNTKHPPEVLTRGNKVPILSRSFTTRSVRGETCHQKWHSLWHSFCSKRFV